MCILWLRRSIVKISSRKLVLIHCFCGCRTPRLNSGLTVLTEQTSGGGGRRGGSRESPPPPPAPRAASKSSSRSANGALPLQESKHHGHGGHQWKRYTDSPGVGSPPPPPQQAPPAPAPASPTASRRERRSSPHGGKDKSSKGVRGVPQSFGYVKRSANGVNGTANGSVPVQGKYPLIVHLEESITQYRMGKPLRMDILYTIFNYGSSWCEAFYGFRL